MRHDKSWMDDHPKLATFMLALSIAWFPVGFAIMGLLSK